MSRHHVDVPREDVLMDDPVHVEHLVNFQLYHVGYPFEDMDKLDFFRIPTPELAQSTRTAIQRYYVDGPISYFVVRRHKDEWICRRVV